MPTNILPFRRPQRPPRIPPGRRRVRDRLEDFSFSVIGEANVSRDHLVISLQLLEQEQPRLDLVTAHITDILPRLGRIADAGRELSAVAERVVRRDETPGKAS